VSASLGDGAFDEDAAAWSPPSYVATYSFILPPGTYAASVTYHHFDFHLTQHFAILIST